MTQFVWLERVYVFARAVRSVGAAVAAEADDVTVRLRWTPAPSDVSMTSNVTSLTVYWCLAVGLQRGACAVSLVMIYCIQN